MDNNPTLLGWEEQEGTEKNVVVTRILANLYLIGEKRQDGTIMVPIHVTVDDGSKENRVN